jgi:hypothetical protein
MCHIVKVGTFGTLGNRFTVEAQKGDRVASGQGLLHFAPGQCH